MSSNKVGFENDSLLLGKVQSAVAFGSNILTDGGFEIWAETPDGWWIDGVGAGLKPTKSTDSRGGTYAVELHGAGGSGITNASAIGEIVEGLTPADSYTPSIYGKGDGETLMVIYGYEDLPDYYLWNFNTQEWDLDSGGLPSGDHIYESSALTGAYTQVVFPAVTVPSAGSVEVDFVSRGDGVLVDDAALKKDGTGPNVFTNSDFELWTTSTSDLYYWFNPSGNNIIREDTIVRSGSYAAKFIGSVENNGCVAQLRTGLTTGQYYRVTAWARYDTETDLMIGAANETFPFQTQWWNFTNQEWDTVTEGANPTADQVYTMGLTASYQQFTSGVFTVPSTGKLMCMVAGKFEVANAYLDDAVVQAVTFPTTTTLFDNVNATDPSNLVATDYIFKHRTTGGTPKTHFGQKSDGSFQTDYALFDFTGKPMKVASVPDDDPQRPVNQGFYQTHTEVILGIAEDVDLTVDGYTVILNPTKRFFPTKFILRVKTAVAVTVQPTIRIGTTSDEARWIGDPVLTVGSPNTYKIYPLEDKVLVVPGEVGDPVRFRVLTIGAATAYTADIYAIGFYDPVEVV